MADKLIEDEINRIWSKICHGNAQPVAETELLLKRLRGIEAQLDCAVENFRAANNAYCLLDKIVRSGAGNRRIGIAERRIGKDRRIKNESLNGLGRRVKIRRGVFPWGNKGRRATDG